MNRLELQTPPVIGEDGWVAFDSTVSLPDDTAMQIVCDDGNTQQGHAIEFKGGYLRGVPIIGYKLVSE